MTNAPLDGRWGTTSLKGMNGSPTSRSIRQLCANAGSPTGRESYGDGAPIVVAGVTPGHGGRESRPQGEGAARENGPEPVLGRHGALTPGATSETADGMTLAKIDAIIDALRFERYRWTPVRRTYVPKANGRKRP